MNEIYKRAYELFALILAANESMGFGLDCDEIKKMIDYNDFIKNKENPAFKKICELAKFQLRKEKLQKINNIK